MCACFVVLIGGGFFCFVAIGVCCCFFKDSGLARTVFGSSFIIAVVHQHHYSHALHPLALIL